MKQEAELRYLGHSTVAITSDTGKAIIIDPWLSGNPSCPEQYLEPKAVDFVILTHGHSDHASSAVHLAKRYGAKIFATYELAMLLGKDGVPEQQLVAMNKGGTVQTSLDNSASLQVTLTQAFHSSSYDAADGNTYYAGEAAGIVLRLESGKTIYHAGDTLLFSDMALIGKKYRPSVGFFPIGDRFTMDPLDAAEAVRLVQPQVAIPIHWGTFPPLIGTPEQFAKAVAASGSTSKVLTLHPGESCAVSS